MTPEDTNNPPADIPESNPQPEAVSPAGPPEADKPAAPQPQVFSPAAAPSAYAEQPPAAPGWGTGPEAVAPEAAKPETNPGLIVLQWLTYAFWGWTVLALSVLTSTVVSSFIADSDTGGFMPYGVAAVLVLLPISYVCDAFYSKREPAKKQGAEIWVMVIHVVIFALFGIGALITAAVSVVLLITSGADSKGSLVALLSSLIITAFYALTFLRTLNPAITRWLQKGYKMLMIVLVGIIALLGIIGPLAKERATHDDKLVVAELPTVSTSINNYAKKHNKLPAGLSDLELRGDAQKLVDKDLVEYKPESSTEASTLPAGSSSGAAIYGSADAYNSSRSGTLAYKYQLCTKYTAESSGYSQYDSDSSLDTDGYDSYLSVYNHPKGEVCYKLKTLDY